MDGGFHQLAAANVLDVIALDLVERVGKQLLQLVFLGDALGRGVLVAAGFVILFRRCRRLFGVDRAGSGQETESENGYEDSQRRIIVSPLRLPWTLVTA